MDDFTKQALYSGGMTGLNLAATGIAARKNREFINKTNRDNKNTAWEFHNASRTEAVMDRDYENSYNSPKQQMQRLKEAGLNPRLIYGGSTGIMAAANTKQAASDTPKQEAPQIDIRAIQQGLEPLQGVMGKYIELTNLQAQTDNLRQTRELIEAQSKYTAAETGEKIAKTNTEIYNLDYAKRTEPIRTSKAIADLTFTLDENDRHNLSTSSNVAKTLQEIILMKIEEKVKYEGIAKSKQERVKLRQDIENLKATLELTKNEAAVLKADLELKKQGIQPHDAAWQRKLMEILNRKAEPIKELNTLDLKKEAYDLDQMYKTKK